MYPSDLKTFLHLGEQADQLTRVKAPVDPYLELATIVDQVGMGRGMNRVLLFEQVVGSSLPVVTNLFGRRERIAWAMGSTGLEEVAARLAEHLALLPPCNAATALQQLTAAPECRPMLVSRPDWNGSTASLAALPRVTAWPGDGGPYLTLAQTYSRHPDGGALNCGMYRIQLRPDGHAALRCRPSSGAACHLAAWEAQGRAMPVAVALGGPPVMSWAAGVALPETVEEAALCGLLTGHPLDMSCCQHSDLCVPATADIVIEGFIRPGVRVAEGPFGNHTGSYDSAAAAPLLTVTAVHLHPAAILPWTLVGPPPRENLQLVQATAEVFLPLLRHEVPSVRQLYLPGETGFHRAALVTVDPGEERPFAELAEQLWSSLLLRGSRLLVVGRDDDQPAAAAGLLWRVMNRCQWPGDLLVRDGCLAIDARRLPTGGMVAGDPRVVARVLSRWAELRIDG